MTEDSYQQGEPLGYRIRRLRQEQGITQDGLALRANLDQSGLSKIERLRRKPYGPVPLARIAKVLGMTLEELVTGTDHGKDWVL